MAEPMVVAMIKRRPDDEIERLLADDLKNSMVFGPYPYERIKPRLIDRIPPAVWWWLFGVICGAMMTVVSIELFTSIDLGLVPNR